MKMLSPYEKKNSIYFVYIQDGDVGFVYIIKFKMVIGFVYIQDGDVIESWLLIWMYFYSVSLGDTVHTFLWFIYLSGTLCPFVCPS
jgi:hypothetical protein